MLHATDSEVVPPTTTLVEAGLTAQPVNAGMTTDGTTDTVALYVEQAPGFAAKHTVTEYNCVGTLFDRVTLLVVVALVTLAGTGSAHAYV